MLKWDRPSQYSTRGDLWWERRPRTYSLYVLSHARIIIIIHLLRQHTCTECGRCPSRPTRRSYCATKPTLSRKGHRESRARVWSVQYLAFDRRVLLVTHKTLEHLHLWNGCEILLHRLPILLISAWELVLWADRRLIYISERSYYCMFHVYTKITPYSARAPALTLTPLSAGDRVIYQFLTRHIYN